MRQAGLYCFLYNGRQMFRLVGPNKKRKAGFDFSVSNNCNWYQNNLYNVQKISYFSDFKESTKMDR